MRWLIWHWCKYRVTYWKGAFSFVISTIQTDISRSARIKVKLAHTPDQCQLTARRRAMSTHRSLIARSYVFHLEIYLLSQQKHNVYSTYGWIGGVENFYLGGNLFGIFSQSVFPLHLTSNSSQEKTPRIYSPFIWFIRYFVQVKITNNINYDIREKK